jgi:hypothetical protein
MQHSTAIAGSLTNNGGTLARVVAALTDAAGPMLLTLGHSGASQAAWQLRISSESASFRLVAD